jgi:hypothetical protein
MWLYSSMPSAVECGEWSAARPGRTIPRERPGSHRTEGWKGPTAGVDRRGKYRSHRDSIPGLSSP